MSFSNSLSFFKNRLPTFFELHDACRVDVARKFPTVEREERFVKNQFWNVPSRPNGSGTPPKNSHLVRSVQMWTRHARTHADHKWDPRGIIDAGRSQDSLFTPLEKTAVT
jgi:hypothetical protein